MSNRKGADLGLTLVNLGYVVPTPASIGACKSTVGAGLPSFAGRTAGDLHRNSTNGLDYKLTGTPGAPVKSESFAGRANGSTIVGTPLEIGGVNWAASDSASNPVVTSNLIRATSSDDMGAFHALAAGAQDVQADLTFLQLGFCEFGVRCTSGVRASGYWLVMDFTGVKLYKGGVSTLVATFSAVAVTSGTFRLTIDNSATPTITAYKDDVQIGAPYTDVSGSPQTGAAVGWELGQGNGGSVTTLDNWSALAVGSLAWTQAPTLAGLGYVAPTAASLGATKSTVGAGLPGFSGRTAGDLHRNLTDSKQYTLTGAPGSTITDTFDRADAATLGATTSSGAAYTFPTIGGSGSSASQFNIASNQVTASVNNRTAFVTMTSGGKDLSMSVTPKWTGDALTLWSQCNVDASTGYQAVVQFAAGSATITIYRNGTQIATATVTDASWKVDGTVTYTCESVAAASGQVLMQVTNGVSGQVLSASYTDTTPLANIYAGYKLTIAGVAPNRLVADNFVAIDLGTMAWVTSASGLVWKNAWSATPAYAQNDVVSRAYGLYVALTIPPAGTDPVTPLGAPARVGANGGDIASGASNFGGAVTDQSFAWPFTVSGPTTVTAVEVLVATTGNIPAGVKVGIASDFASGRTGGAPFLGSHVTTAAMTPGWNTVVLDTPVPLVAGTTYRYVLESGDIRNLQYAGSAGPYTGLVASTNTGLASSGAPSTTYGSTVGLYAPFRIDASPTQYWQKLANTGNQENVGQVAASGAAVTIADPEIQPITRVVLSANCTITLPAVVAGKSFTVVVVQDATGGRTLTWAGPAVLWPGGAAPTQTATASKGDVYSFMADGSGNWLGFVGGQNY